MHLKTKEESSSEVFYASIKDEIKEGEKGVQKAMLLMSKNVAFLKSAKSSYKSFEKKLSSIATAEDIFRESICRFIEAVLDGNGPNSNCYGFFFQICKNYCLELSRKQAPLMEDMKDTADESEYDPIRDEHLKLGRYFFDMLDKKCQKLLGLTYFRTPLNEALLGREKELKNKETEVLATELGVNIPSIAPMRTRCRDKWIELMRKNIHLFER